MSPSDSDAVSALADDRFRESRVRLLQAVRDHGRRNQLTLTLCVVLSVCAVATPLSLIRSGANLSDSTSLFIAIFSLRGLTSVLLLETSRRLMGMYRRGACEIARYKQKLDAIVLSTKLGLLSNDRV